LFTGPSGASNRRLRRYFDLALLKLAFSSQVEFMAIQWRSAEESIVVVQIFRKNLIKTLKTATAFASKADGVVRRWIRGVPRVVA
jgi:hypothetical protein